MKIMGLGIDYSTGSSLLEPVDEQDFGKQVAKSLLKNAESLHALMEVGARALTTRGEVKRRIPDPGDPRSAGWTFLVNGNDPQYEDIVKTIGRFAKERRGMENPQSPLVYHGEGPDEWYSWTEEHYRSVDRVRDLQKAPHYILIVGGPDQVPFHFQTYLDVLASVGRVAFDSLDDLGAYIAKLERLESSPPTMDTVFFAPDGGPHDITYFTRRCMAEPLADHVQTRIARKLGIEVQSHRLVGDDATKEHLLETLRGANPTLVYTASHGIAAKNRSLEVQKRLNGAICCQHSQGQPVDDWLFTAADVPQDGPFLEGAIFFQFACYGYGTPAESDFRRWIGDAVKLNAEEDFVAALPKRLLAHPKGPVAFIGHVDTAHLLGFHDLTNKSFNEHWNNRMEPFYSAINVLLHDFQTVGMAMEDMNERYAATTGQLFQAYEDMRAGKEPITDKLLTELAKLFIQRGDAQNYMIFGDPAVRLQVPSS